MICDAPLAGHGQGAFQAKYMLYQADYFTAHPDSKYTALADNVLHPFNEYLLVFAEHGLMGLAFLALLGFLLFRSYRKERSNAKRTALLSLLALAVFSCFSYPFKYPFTWLIAFLNIAVIFYPTRIFQNTKLLNIITKTAVAIAVFGIFFTAIPRLKAEMKWNKTAHQSLAGKTREVLPEYDKLYRYLGKNGLFLYNHAAELHEIKEYERSIAVFSLCTVYYNDMDVQMLLADNYKELQRYEKAEQHLKLAATMCPARFMPLYELAELYNETGRKAEAVALARQIADKNVKIPSATVFAIKQKMRQLIEKSEAEEKCILSKNKKQTNIHHWSDGYSEGQTSDISVRPP
jgi:tetratricopeptide (TPR) repeat protein